MGRRAVYGICGAIIVCLVLGGGCGWSAIRMGRAILEGRADIFNNTYPVVAWCGNGLPFMDRLRELLNDKTYIVLLQNNTELRPTGGFMGSYVKIETKGGVIKDWAVKDIYDPDGKLPGHVEPPYPIQESFRQGWWKLRDSNWDPDFASAAATISWFFEQGGEKVDGIAALNLGFIQRWLTVMGPVKVNSFEQELTADNFYSLAQGQAEVRIENNVTRKRDFLGAAGTALVEQTKAAAIKKLASLAKLTFGELKNKQLLLWSKDDNAEFFIKQKGWGGELDPLFGAASDYLYIVDANLGANKSNCCIERNIVQSIDHEKERLFINWINNSKFENPVPPDFWGGNYINYVRVIIPSDAKIEELAVDGQMLRRAGADDFSYPNSLRQSFSRDMYAVEERGNLQLVGFWAFVNAGSTASAVLEYENPKGDATLLVRRQPGIESFFYTLIVNGKNIWEGLVKNDKEIAI